MAFSTQNNHIHHWKERVLVIEGRGGRYLLNNTCSAMNINTVSYTSTPVDCEMIEKDGSLV